MICLNQLRAIHICSYSSGIYTLTPRAVIGRESIMGPGLEINVIANTENPVKINYECEDVNVKVIVGQPWLSMCYFFYVCHNL